MLFFRVLGEIFVNESFPQMEQKTGGRVEEDYTNDQISQMWTWSLTGGIYQVETSYLVNPFEQTSQRVVRDRDTKLFLHETHSMWYYTNKLN